MDNHNRLTPIERSVLTLLRRGQSHTITAKILSERLEQPDRFIRQVILGLIEKGIPIASSNEPPMGYYIAETYAEALEYRQQLISRIKGDAYRLKYFKVAVQKNVQPKQGVLI